jgi:hypothetical protein
MLLVCEQAPETVCFSVLDVLGASAAQRSRQPSPGYRGGVGGALLRNAKPSAREGCCKRPRGSRQQPACARLYERFGFEDFVVDSPSPVSSAALGLSAGSPVLPDLREPALKR